MFVLNGIFVQVRERDTVKVNWNASDTQSPVVSILIGHAAETDDSGRLTRRHQRDTRGIRLLGIIVDGAKQQHQRPEHSRYCTQ